MIMTGGIKFGEINSIIRFVISYVQDWKDPQHIDEDINSC